MYLHDACSDGYRTIISIYSQFHHQNVLQKFCWCADGVRHNKSTIIRKYAELAARSATGMYATRVFVLVVAAVA